MNDHTAESPWPPGPAQPRVAPDTVHIWLADCRAYDALDLVATLTPEEQQRIARYKRPEDRQRAAMARIVLRRLLAAYIGCGPAEVVILRGPMGKPAIDMPGVRLPFSISHSRDLVLYAISGGPAVGVDIECMDRQLDLAGVTKAIATEAERAYLRTLPTAEQRAAFFRLWTSKEACVKCSGEGLNSPLAQIETTPAELATWSEARREATRWLITQLAPAAAHAAALAVASPRPPDIAYWSFLAHVFPPRSR